MRQLTDGELDVVSGGYADPTADPTKTLYPDQVINVRDYFSMFAVADGGSVTCPAGHNCVAVSTDGETWGRYVKDTADGKIYLTEEYNSRLQEGTINWGGFWRDMAIITGGALGGVGAGLAGIVGGMLTTFGWGWDRFDPPPSTKTDA